MHYLLGSIAKIIITFIRNKVLSQGLYVLGSKISNSTFDSTRKRYGATDLLKCARPFNIKVDMDRDMKRKLLASPLYMESRLSTIGVINCGLWKIGEKILYAGTNVKFAILHLHSSILSKVKFNTTGLGYAPMSWVVINCFGSVCVINGQDALVYWVSGVVSPHEGVISQQHIVGVVFWKGGKCWEPQIIIYAL